MSTEPIRVFAPAKINLFLHVGARRDNGYHELQSLMAFADVGDDLAIEAGDGLSLTVEGTFVDALAREANNIVLKAALALAERAGVAPNARISLTKNLPVASGLGGGSSDAAAALRGLCKLWRVSVTEADLQTIAAGLGSDVPVCLKGTPCWVEGAGEKLTVVPIFPTLYAVLVNPGIAVSTAQVYGAVQSKTGTQTEHPATFADAIALVDFLKTTTNDLQSPAIKLVPVISDVLAVLQSEPSTLLARMSGSGATCFGIFKSKDEARAVAEKVASAHGEWWVKPVRIA